MTEILLPLSNDLIGITATYTVPSVTERLITLDQNSADRLAYDPAFGMWRRKVEFELRGVVFQDSVIQRNGGARTWYSYYRIVNAREYGTPAIMTSHPELIRLPHTDSTGLSVHEASATAHIFTRNTWYIYHPKFRREPRYKLLHTIAIKGAMWAGQIIGAKDQYYVITERGELFEYYRGKLWLITRGVVLGICDNGLLRVLERTLGWCLVSCAHPFELRQIFQYRDRIVWLNKGPADYMAYTSDGTGLVRYYGPTPVLPVSKWTQEIPVVLFTGYLHPPYNISIEGNGSALPYRSDTARYFYRERVPAVRGFCFSLSRSKAHEIPYMLLADGTVTKPETEILPQPLRRLLTFPPIYLAQTEGTTTVVIISS